MQTMHKTIGSLVVVGLLLGAGSVSAQSYSIQFDEWGNGFFNGNIPLKFTQSALEPLFSNQSTLMYELPFEVTRGDVYLTESSDGTISDLIRFDNITNTAGTSEGVAYFFSDPPDPGETPVPYADTGVPPLSPLPSVGLPEAGPEGNDGATYFAANGSPGCALVGGQVSPVTYGIVSDGTVPEPSTVVLLVVGAVALLGYTWRRRTQIV